MLHYRIKDLRLSRGLNQVELAKELGVSKQCISNWENDNIQPSIDMLIKIADYFGVSTDYLLGRSNIPLLDISGLALEEIAHVRMIISDIKNKHYRYL